MTGILLTVLAVLTVATMGLVFGRRLRWSLDVAELGCMSERWLAENRASHSS